MLRACAYVAQGSLAARWRQHSVSGDRLCQWELLIFNPPPTNSTSLYQSPKNCQRWLHRRPLPEYQIWCKSTHKGLLGKCKKYNQFYLLVYTLFLGTHLQVTAVGEFSHWMAQTTRTCPRMCLLGFSDIAVHLGDQIPPNPYFKFWAWIGVFKPNAPIIETFILSKLLHWSQQNFAQ